MSRNPMQKQKLLYLRKILLEKTDENHGLTSSEILAELAFVVRNYCGAKKSLR